MNTSLPQQYIVVEGPIGVGKTHLVNRLADSFSGTTLFEQPEQNPFLEKFYTHPQQSALPTQLSFLMQRIKLSKNLQQDDLFHDLQISDFMIDKDRLFAQITLDDDELALYNMVYDNLTMHSRVPDLVIYLQAPMSVLKNRISQRGIGYEQRIEDAYLQRLTESYADFFHYYEASPLLIVNAEQINLVDSEQDYENLIEQVARCTSGRHYYNPLPVKEK
ncbi:MAG: deoxynucleoside kinase [Piscirickettsiaceae bacterium]|jgi:deoxyguanosine kinase|nr:deoxynucleoside kinase [Piscirickettsiaceae bacterium]